MKLLVLVLCVIALVGCKLSPEESTIAQARAEIAARKKLPPPGSLTEEQMGVKFYPDADQFQSREYDEGGFHILEVGLNTPDAIEKVTAFYEQQLGAKAVKTMADMYAIRKDEPSRTVEVSYGRFDQDTTITVKVSKPTG